MAAAGFFYCCWLLIKKKDFGLELLPRCELNTYLLHKERCGSVVRAFAHGAMETLLLIRKSSPCGGSGFPLSLPEWSFTIRPTPYNRKIKCVEYVIK